MKKKAPDAVFQLFQAKNLPAEFLLRIYVSVKLINIYFDISIE